MPFPAKDFSQIAQAKQLECQCRPSKDMYLENRIYFKAILDFPLLLLVKLSLLILFAFFLVSVLCFFFGSFLSKVIALPTIAIAIVIALSKRLPLLFANRATTIAVAIVGRAITIWEAIQKSSYEPIYETHTSKIEAKRLRATTFAITKLEERYRSIGKIGNS